MVTHHCEQRRTRKKGNKHLNVVLTELLIPRPKSWVSLPSPLGSRGRRQFLFVPVELKWSPENSGWAHPAELYTSHRVISTNSLSGPTIVV